MQPRPAETRLIKWELNSVMKLTAAKSVCTGAESVGAEFKPLGTVPVRVLPPIVPAPTAQSRAAGWLNQRWEGRRPGTLMIASTGFSAFSTSVSDRLH